MAKKSEDNKNLIVGICGAVAAVVVIVVLIVVLAINGGGISDDYFKSDDTKYVLTLPSEATGSSDEEYSPVQSHMVYTYQDDTITGLKIYAEYADAETASKAYDVLKKAQEEAAQEDENYEAIDYELNGKYIIQTAKEEDYKDLKASDVKQQIEFMEMLKNMDTEDGGEDDSGEEEKEEEEEEN